MPCDDTNLGKECIHAARNALFFLPAQDKAEDTSADNECAEASRPTVLWSVVYVQEVKQVAKFQVS